MTLVRADWQAARAAAREAGLAGRRPADAVPLVEAVGRTLAAELRSLARVPGFDASAMDGWAVSGHGPWTVGTPIVAGPVTGLEARLVAGSARPITTGAPTPAGTERVLRSESGRVVDDLLTAVGEPSSPPRHVRRAGEEAEAGDLLFEAGTHLTPPRVAVAAVCGLDTVPVAPLPRVALAVLGDEIVGAGVARPGTVRDVFSVQLPRLLRSLGADPVSAERVPDDLDATTTALDRPDVSLVVTTGGTAHSSTDHIREALARSGAELVVEGLAMRPGQPVLLARRHDTLYLCLPGNPMAALVCLVVVGVPLIEGLLGRRPAPPALVTLAVDVPHPRTGVLVQAYRATDGGAVPTARQSSAMLRGLADADGLLVVPEGGARAGDAVPSIALPW